MTLQQLRYAVCVADKKSMNQAASDLFMSQPSLSAAIADLEEEIGIAIFNRSNRGVTVTTEGNEFLGYARQLLEQYRLIDERYIEKTEVKQKFSVSMQHYTFAVKAFVELVKQFDMGKYEFAIHETKTFTVIENVRDFYSELGILYRNDFNQKVLGKILAENGLEFVDLFECKVYVSMWQGNPLAEKALLTMEDLEDYPCLSFEQGKNNSFYLAEEVLSTYQYKKVIKADDRATLLNMMRGVNAYTLCSGIVCEELNGSEYIAVPLDVKETMTIGYIKRAGLPLSKMAKKYIAELLKYRDSVMK